jgi:hypothetical protein
VPSGFAGAIVSSLAKTWLALQPVRNLFLPSGEGAGIGERDNFADDPSKITGRGRWRASAATGHRTSHCSKRLLGLWERGRTAERRDRADFGPRCTQAAELLYFCVNGSQA